MTPVVSVRLIVSSAAAASKRSISAIAPPLSRLAFITPLMPSTCESGATAS